MATTLTQTLVSKTETSITMNWVANTKINRVRYSSNNGSSWTSITVSAKSGSYTISGLTANTTYKIKTEVRSADDSSITTSSALSVKTYDWPKATCPTVAIAKEKLVITLTNPMNRPCEVEVYVGSTFIDSFSNVVKSVSLPTSYANAFLSQIPNASTGTYTVNVYYGNNTKTTSGTFTSEGAEPELTGLNYEDTDSATQAILHDTSVILQNHSIVKYTPICSAKYGASMSSVDIVVDGRQGATALHMWIIMSYPIRQAQDVVAKVTVEDSRGNTTTKKFTIFVTPYESPSALITLGRQNNYYSETDLKVDARVFNTSASTNVPTITARYREKDTTTWYNWPAITNYTTSTQVLNNQKAWDVEVTVTDSFGGSKVYTQSVPIGMPILFIDRGMRAIGINCFPTADEQLRVDDIDVLDMFVPHQLTLNTTGAPSTVTTINFTGYRVGNLVTFTLEVVVTAAHSSWTTIGTGLPAPPANWIVTASQWATSYTRPLRIGVTTSGNLNIIYGASGSYRISMTYPVV